MPALNRSSPLTLSEWGYFISGNILWVFFSSLLWYVRSTFCVVSLLGCGCPSSSLTFQEGIYLYSELGS